MERIVKKPKSVRVKLFLILCLVVLSIIAFLILVNSFVLEKYYQYTKSNNLKSTYALINSYYTGQISVDNISDELDKISISNNFDIIIKDNEIGLLNCFDIYIITIPPTIITIHAIKYKNLLDI